MTDEEIKRVAEEAAKAAVEEMFVRFGLPTDKPTDVQKDFAHLRAWREASETVKKQGLITAVGIITVALIGLIWTAISKGHG